MSGVISFTPQARRFLVSVTPSHHRPRHPGELVGQCDGRDLGRTPRQQRREPRPMPGAMNFGIADYGERTSHERAAQIAVTLFADTAELVLAAARVLLGDQPDTGP